MVSLWEALKESQNINDYKIKGLTKQMYQHPQQAQTLMIKSLDAPQQTETTTIKLFGASHQEEDVWQKGPDPWTQDMTQQELRQKTLEWGDQVKKGAKQILVRIGLSDGNIIHDFNRIEVDELNKVDVAQTDEKLVDWADVDKIIGGGYDSPPPKRTRRKAETFGAGESGPIIEEELHEILHLVKGNGDRG